MIELKLHKPNYFFIRIDDSLLNEYALGFSLGDIFKIKGVGISSGSDKLLVNTKLDKLKENIKLHLESENSPFKGVKLDKKEKDSNGVYKIFPYKVFDNRFLYDSRMIEGKRADLTNQETIENNYYLCFSSTVRDNNKFQNICFTKTTLNLDFFCGKSASYSAPLYIYNEQNKGQ